MHEAICLPSLLLHEHSSQEEAFECAALGISYERTDPFIRGVVALAAQELEQKGAPFPFVLLSTCNRLEIYYSTKEWAEAYHFFFTFMQSRVPSLASWHWDSYFGQACLAHLIGVVSGVKSANLFETEIKAQTKEAYARAQEKRILSKELHFLFQQAFFVAKKIRLHFGLEKMGRSLGGLVQEAAKNHFCHVEEVSLLFVGASWINRQILSSLPLHLLKRVALCSRSPERAKRWIRSYTGAGDGRAIVEIPWDDQYLWSQFDWLIFGTKSSRYLLSSVTDWPKGPLPKLICDLSIPQNVNPIVGASFHLLNIDQILEKTAEQTSHIALKQTILAHIQTRAHNCLEKFVPSSISLPEKKPFF